jgi:putative transcriptional regulator
LKQRVSGRRFAVATKPKYKGDLSEAIHSSASALYSIGAIDQETMRSYDASCLVPTLEPKQIKKLRQRYLNTSESTIEKWESGAKKPSGMALKLLSVVEKHGLKMLS